jgi:hypothetical protein
MFETIERVDFPLFARMIQPFDDSFDQFSADLKKAAEGSVDA